MSDLRVGPGFRGVTMIGLTADGQFKTSALQLYPPQLNQRIAELFLEARGDTPEPAVTLETCCARGGCPPELDLGPLPSAELFPNTDAPRPKETPWWQIHERFEVATEVATWKWRAIFALPCRDDQHINSKEPRATRVYLRRTLKRKSGRRKKLLLLVDSRVALGALAHGRSPSAPVNAYLKSIIPDPLAWDTYLVPLWVPSEANPSDPPSRKRPLDVVRAGQAGEPAPPTLGAAPATPSSRTTRPRTLCRAEALTATPTSATRQ